ncbi:hypothetical protein ACIP10_01800 [Streptomyces galbus]|uniref:hypothetical protein n=1 Tax=Streptomyces galbus TaxID=33898 RepID=UPI0037B131FF
MTEPARDTARRDQDVHFNSVGEGPPRYRARTDKPVQYLTVVDKASGAVLCYVWAGDEDDAAAWVPRDDAGGRALADGGHWHARLRSAKERGLLPSQALAELLASPESNRGRVLPDSLTTAPNSDAVRTLAASTESHPPMATPPQGNPYAPAPPPAHPGQPYAHPGHQGHPGYQAHPAHPQPPTPACRFCGGSPAVPVTFRAHRGLLVVMTFRKLDGPMCGTCGVAVYRALTTETLWQGWWSPFSLFLFTPFTLLRNLVVSRKVKKLQAPAPGQHGRQVDPGVPVHRRPLAYVGLVPVLWLLFMIVSGLTRNS